MKKNTSLLFAAISLILIAAVLIYIPSPSNKRPQSNNIEQPPTVLYFNNSATLLSHFKSSNYLWPINGKTEIPSTLIRSMPSDINLIRDVKTRKTLFIRVMLPIILAEQKRIRDARKILKLAFHSNISNEKINEQIDKLFVEYKVSDKLTPPEKNNHLLQRFDELPITLVLAQAAIESGWGTSRFTRVGNSLFGEWTYQKGQGIVPEGRTAGKTHEIKAFPSLRASIASYTRNINRNNAYKELRQLRIEMRLAQQPLDSRKLAEGLQRYSQKGKAYVVSLLQIINSKEFKMIETLNLSIK